MSKYLFTGDIHLTSRPRDEYRWGIFSWLKTQAINRGVSTIFILGDLTDQKDHHPSRLVNRLVDELHSLDDFGLFILKGNHDYTDPEEPFFKFLAGSESIRYIIKPERIGDFLFLPHTKRWRADWKKVMSKDFKKAKFILSHQTYKGSIASNGFAMEGEVPMKIFGQDRTSATLIAGDIHVPQKIGEITYCGSPHPINFGDSFKPRVLFWDGSKLKSVNRTTIKKEVLTIKTPSDLYKAEVSEGDQVRVNLELKRSQFGDWEELRAEVVKICEERSIYLYGVELRERTGIARKALHGASGVPKRKAMAPLDLFEEYCTEKKINKDLAEFGRGLLESE